MYVWIKAETYKDRKYNKYYRGIKLLAVSNLRQGWYVQLYRKKSEKQWVKVGEPKFGGYFCEPSYEMLPKNVSKVRTKTVDFSFKFKKTNGITKSFFSSIPPERPGTITVLGIAGVITIDEVDKIYDLGFGTHIRYVDYYTKKPIYLKLGYTWRKANERLWKKYFGDPEDFGWLTGGLKNHEVRYKIKETRIVKL